MKIKLYLRNERLINHSINILLYTMINLQQQVRQMSSITGLEKMIKGYLLYKRLVKVLNISQQAWWLETR